MAKSNQQEIERDAPTTGYLEVPDEPDTNPTSLTEAVLADMATDPPKKKAGRPKKEVVQDIDDDDSAPPEHLMQEEPEEEPDTEATEGDDEVEEPTELESQLTALARETGVEPELLEGMSMEEAERFVNRLYRAYYRDGQNGYEQNGHSQNGHSQNGHAQNGERQPAAEAVQKIKSLDINLDDFDDDEPLKPVLKKLVEHIDAQTKKIGELESADEKRQYAEFERAQRAAALEFQNELYRISSDLFGTEKKQTPRQVRQIHAAIDAGETLIRGLAARGAPLPSIARLAKWAVQAEFAEELANNKLLAQRQSVSERAKKRLGAPARVSRGNVAAPSAKVYEGNMQDDPDILAAVRSSLSRVRN